MSAPIASRLLSLLSLVEIALNKDGAAMGVPCVSFARVVNFPKGLARLTINEGAGVIFFQHFDLADGSTCVRATETWADREETGHAAIYPQGDDFDWAAAASQVAAVWLAGPKAVESITPVAQTPALKSAI